MATRATHSANGAHNYSLRTTAKPEEDALDEFLKTRTREGFASSAYWGATGEMPPHEADDTIPRDSDRFGGEINRKLMPFPKDLTSLPRRLESGAVGGHRMLTDGMADAPTAPGMSDAQMATLRSLTDGDGQGRVPRLLTTRSTQQSIPRDFDADVLQTLADGKALEGEMKRRIDDLKGMPRSTADPDPYRLTSDDYCDMGGIDRPAYCVTETVLGEPGEGDGGDWVYRTRYNNVEREGPKRRDRTHLLMELARNVDPKELQRTLVESRARTMPRGYQPYSASEWMSTTHREHAAYDPARAASANDRFATEPLRNVNYGLTAQHEQSLSEKDRRFQTRHDGTWGTEYSDHYVDRSGESKVVRDHVSQGVFDVVDGIYTMNHVFHHPRDDVHTGETYTPAELVPGQYATMSRKPLHSRNPLDGTL